MHLYFNPHHLIPVQYLIRCPFTCLYFPLSILSRLILLCSLSSDRIIGIGGTQRPVKEIISLALNCLISSYQKEQLSVYFSLLLPSQNCLWSKQVVQIWIADIIISIFLWELLSVYLSRKLLRSLWQYCWATWALRIASEFDQCILIRLSSLLLDLFLSGYIQEECAIPCPFDCKLSDWSSWGSCSSSCGIGVRIRSKWLKEKPYNGGRPCPTLDLKNQVQCMKQQIKS